jgi:hypothetical protein
MPITTITSGIKYIKISKTDLAGANRNSDLNSLQKLRLKYNDIGVIEYDIINISEFSDHYLYAVFTNNNVSATDNEILNYNFLQPKYNLYLFLIPSPYLLMVILLYIGNLQIYLIL